MQIGYSITEVADSCVRVVGYMAGELPNTKNGEQHSDHCYQAFQVCDRFVVMAHGAVGKDVRKEDTTLEELTIMIMAS